ncbi:hypothetical protein J6590_083553 [Homalodisca vitripennis]|nr:hypothetical protein J6590_083553 [Homalodisca vitripennis]
MPEAKRRAVAWCTVTKLITNRSRLPSSVTPTASQTGTAPANRSRYISFSFATNRELLSMEVIVWGRAFHNLQAITWNDLSNTAVLCLSILKMYEPERVLPIWSSPGPGDFIHTLKAASLRAFIHPLDGLYAFDVHGVPPHTANVLPANVFVSISSSTIGRAPRGKELVRWCLEMKPSAHAAENVYETSIKRMNGRRCAAFNKQANDIYQASSPVDGWMCGVSRP